MLMDTLIFWKNGIIQKDWKSFNNAWKNMALLILDLFQKLTFLNKYRLCPIYIARISFKLAWQWQIILLNRMISSFFVNTFEEKIRESSFRKIKNPNSHSKEFCQYVRFWTANQEVQNSKIRNIIHWICMEHLLAWMMTSCSD